MTTPYSEVAQTGEWLQFDPNVHYYYDEQNQLHYYDPNTNQEYNYRPQYETQQQQQQHHNYYGHNTNGTLQNYTTVQQHQQSANSNYAAEIASSRQGTPDVFSPCPDPTCNGENKAKSKFCEECGRPLGAISRSGTPAIPLTNVSGLTRTFSQHQIQDNTNAPIMRTATPPVNYNANYYSPQQQQQQQQQQQSYVHPAPPQAPLQRPPTAPVYSTVDTLNYYPPSQAGGNANTNNQFDPRYQQQGQLYYNGFQHQSMQDLYGLNQVQQQQQQQPQKDPLDRARGCPILSFGFGGKMLITFPRAVTDYYSSTVKPKPGPIKIQTLKSIVKSPLLLEHTFPGPILFDNKFGGTKQKKKDVVNYISARLDAFEKEKLAFEASTSEYHQLQAKMLLWQLVKVMVETDGTVNDKDKMDQAILQILRPTITDVDEPHFTLPSGYTVNDQQQQQQQQDDDISEHMLNKIEQYLLNGDRKGAVDYAVQEDLWAHALIISSCVDKQLWQKVIANFVDREMNATPEMRRNRNFNNIAGNNQALRVMYSLFSGAGGVAMNEFLKSDVQHVNTPYGLQAVTPPAQLDQLVKWRDTLAIILANRTPRDLEALAAFGDILKEQGWIDAAHICYLLSPQNSMHSGIDTIQVRLTLLGSDRPTLEAYQLTEMLEFASSLYNAGACLPFLQGYKLAHAWILADYGYLNEAESYHDAIDQSIKSFTKGSPYLHQQLIDQVAAFGAYLENATGKKNGVDPGSWLKPKFQKKALTTLWGTLEGSFTKFVSGEELPQQDIAPSRKSSEIMGRPF